jgi:predicted transcriptional regulator of viral defense system
MSKKVDQGLEPSLWGLLVLKPLLILMKAEETSHPSPAVGQRQRALSLLATRGMLRLKDFAQEGIGPETLTRLLKERSVIRRARGLYQLAAAEVESAHTLAEAALLVPKGVVCLISALQFHGLTLQMPSAVWVAIERTSWRPKIDYPPIRFVRWTARALEEGVETHPIEGVPVHITNPARTVVDCFRYRNKIGIDVALEGLREALRTRRVSADDLWQRAQGVRVWSVMKPYVDATVTRE